MRQYLEFDIENTLQFKSQLLLWLKQVKQFSFLNSNAEQQLSDSETRHPTYDFLLAAEAVDQLTLAAGNAFSELKKMLERKKDWIFGYLAYDLKNEIEKLDSQNDDELLFPELHFFQPRFVFCLNKNKLRIEYLPQLNTPAQITLLMELIRASNPAEKSVETPAALILSKVSKDEYLHSVQKIKAHIQRGDIYEMNYCVEFFSKNHHLNPFETYEELNAISHSPFSCCYRNDSNYLICSSPERFLKKSGSKIISQPIKGTRKRGSNLQEDNFLKEELLNDAKERSENVMIVDLVRNDLSRSAKRGSVQVDDLFGVHTFEQVHQLISTVSSELREDIHAVDAIKMAFPMGSMTGAPKVSAMKISENFEKSKRGLYSGAVGYFTPQGDFDFNVVIRSILYNSATKYCSFMVGSAITINSTAEQEYAECLLKAEAMFQALNGNMKE